MAENTNYPMGGFVCDAVCPWCNKPMKVNVPAKPNDNRPIVATVNCPQCGKQVITTRLPSGDWKISQR